MEDVTVKRRKLLKDVKGEVLFSLSFVHSGANHIVCSHGLQRKKEQKGQKMRSEKSNFSPTEANSPDQNLNFNLRFRFSMIWGVNPKCHWI